MRYSFGEIFFDAVQHGLHLTAVTLFDFADMSIDIIVSHVLPKDALRKMGGVQVGGLFGDNQFFYDIAGRCNPPDPQTGGNRLGKRTK